MVSQFAGVGNLAAAYWANLTGRNRDDRRRFTCKSDKLDLVSLLCRINVDDGSNVPGLKPVLGERSGQDDPVVFVNHGGNLSEGMGCDQSVYRDVAIRLESYATAILRKS
jgi:hypothetical protein